MNVRATATVCAVGLLIGIIGYVMFRFTQTDTQLHSPIPPSDGVQILQVTPTPGE